VTAAEIESMADRLCEPLVDRRIADLARAAFEALLDEVGGADALGKRVKRSQVEGLLRLARQHPAHLPKFTDHQGKRAEKLAEGQREPSAAVAFWRTAREAVTANPGPKPKQHSLQALAMAEVTARAPTLAQATERTAVIDALREKLAAPFFQHFAALYLARIERS
jgi:hypothetical protein